MADATMYLCPTGFDEAPKEYVIHAFLGARWKDGKLICPNCQYTFGDGIDVTLAERLRPTASCSVLRAIMAVLGSLLRICR